MARIYELCNKTLTGICMLNHRIIRLCQTSCYSVLLWCVAIFCRAVI